MKNQISQIKMQEFKKELLDFDELLVQDHLTRLDATYFAKFSVLEIKQHLNSILKLSSDQLCHVYLEKKSDNDFIITIVGFDFRGLFSFIAGLLVIYGFDITEGAVFTYSEGEDKELEDKQKKYFLKRRKIIDCLRISHCDPVNLVLDIDKKINQELNQYLLMFKDNKYNIAREDLNKRVSQYIGRNLKPTNKVLMPIEIDVDLEEDATLLDVKGQDTPAFLFSLANALALKEISIQKIFIQTENHRAHDVIWITNADGRPISDHDYLERLKIAVVLIKQFTFLLPNASDAPLAMKHFDQLVDYFLSHGLSHIKNLDLTKEQTLASLAKILGSGDYLWEEFMKMQYASLLPWLHHMEELKIRKTKQDILLELKQRIQNLNSLEEKIKILNDYKDNELLRIDLMHLIYNSVTFIEFSEDLTALAEAVIQSAADLIYEDIKQKNGILNCSCKYGIFALGKFGGIELGYASDLELVLIYEQDGEINQSITYANFFNLLMQQMKTCIKAKSSGIFEIDLRLRPYGNKGELACSFAQWESYYQQSAYDYERQSLIKLRPIAGDQDFCSYILKKRNELIYRQPHISIQNTIELRQKQVETLTTVDQLNAKFSFGGLTELEYSVQFLLLMHGYEYPLLHETNTLKALEKLLEYNIIDPTEFEKLNNSYAFLRRLINSLRMVRGNAKDMNIPAKDSNDFLFLAKRLGYVEKKGLTPEDQLQQEIKEIFNTVHQFYVSQFISKEKILEKPSGLSALVLTEHIDEEVITETLTGLNIKDIFKSYHMIKSMASQVQDTKSLATVLVLAEKFIKTSPDPDKVLIHLQEYMQKLENSSSVLKRMIFYPRTIELLTLIFGYSEYLSNILINDPYFILDLSLEENLFKTKTKEHLFSELEHSLIFYKDYLEKVKMIHQYRNREMLRIGLRDIYLNIGLERIVKEISNLSDVLISTVYLVVATNLNQQDLLNKQVIIALGKLGGMELNYSSDIDIIFVVSDPGENQNYFDALNQALIQCLTEISSLGQIFRVDTTLRPYGASGPLCGTFDFYKNYYETKAHGWELQAWLKARPICGDFKLAENLVQKVHDQMIKRAKEIPQSIAYVRKKMLDKLEKENILDKEVKLGPGGIRGIEFFVQAKQIEYLEKYPDLFLGHTLYAMFILKNYKILSEEVVHELRQAYHFLRKLEHRLQLIGLQQRHVLPDDPEEIEKLAKRMGYEDVPGASAAKQFLDAYEGCISMVKKIVC